MSLLHLHLWECELFLTLGDLRGCFCFFWVFFLPASGSIPTRPLIRRVLSLRISQPLCGSLELSQCSSLFPTLCLLNRKAWASPDSLTGLLGTAWVFTALLLLLLFNCYHVQLFATSWTAAHQASLSITISQSLLKLMSIELVMPSNHFILCRPLLLPPSIVPSIRVGLF